MGFEPTVACATHALQACLIDHSSTSPAPALTMIAYPSHKMVVTNWATDTPSVAVRMRSEIGVLNSGWRRGWDSNPRSTCAETAFRERHHEPLGHLSDKLFYFRAYTASRKRRIAPWSSLVFRGSTSLVLGQRKTARVKPWLSSSRDLAVGKRISWLDWLGPCRVLSDNPTSVQQLDSSTSETWALTRKRCLC